MSETLFKQLAALDAPRPPSAARLAAEAFFSGPPRIDTHDADPTVMVRREALAEEDGPAPSVTPRDSSAGGAPQARAPRVFRVDAAAAAALLPVQPPARRTAEPIRDALEDMPADVPTTKIPRKKGRRLHGDVTTIRPVQSVTPPDALPLMPAPAPHRSQARPTVKAASRRAPQRQPAREAPPAADTWPLYPTLMARIRLLEAEAKALRDSEAAAAAVWIKQAIAKYGLTPHDLGFAAGHRNPPSSDQGTSSEPATVAAT